MRTGIDLFAGIGGFSLAMQMNGIEVIEQVEIEPYPIKVLEKNFPGAKRHGDIRTYKPNANPWIVCGGFPCQDISSAGKGAGLSGKRSSLWWEMHRVIDESRPDWVLIENVSALRTRGSDDVLLSLEKIGYTTEPFVVGALHVGAPQPRKRIWIVGYSNSFLERACSMEGWHSMVEAIKKCAESSCSNPLGNTNRKPVREQSGRSSRTNWQEAIFPALPGSEQYEWEAPRLKSRLGRTIDGISGRVDKHRIKALGNAIVPQVAALIISAIIQTEDQLDLAKTLIEAAQVSEK